ncbi:hypothetical protein V8F06_007026 [Rhypophila decipiens]
MRSNLNSQPPPYHWVTSIQRCPNRAISTMSSEKCMIFIDDSNVWIEAQKFAASGNSHMPKLQATDQDPRLRIDIGKLLWRLLNGRVQGLSFLFGSRPPPNDSVWRAYEKNRFVVKIFDRTWDNKEKMVDTEMVRQITVKATEMRLARKEELANTTFVVITGDADMLPAVEEVVKRCGIRLELWAWRSGIAKQYLKLDENNDLFSFHPLDSIFQDISFTAYRSTRNDFKRAKTMVLCQVDASDEQEVCDRLLATGQVFYSHRLKGGEDLGIEFDEKASIERVIIMARQLFPKVRVLSWPEYQPLNKDPAEKTDKTKATFKINKYALLGDSGNPDSSTPPPVLLPDVENSQLGAGPRLREETPKSTLLQVKDETISGRMETLALNVQTGGSGRAIDNSSSVNGDEGWQTKISKNNAEKRHHRIVNQKHNCQYGLECNKREECSFRHTPKEQRIFRENPRKVGSTANLAKYRTELCRYGPNCYRKRECGYAHSEEEAKCWDCKRTGHLKGDVTKCPLA